MACGHWRLRLWGPRRRLRRRRWWRLRGLRAGVSAGVPLGVWLWELWEGAELKKLLNRKEQHSLDLFWPEGLSLEEGERQRAFRR